MVRGFGGTPQDWGTEEISDGAWMFWWLYFVDPPEKPENFDVYSRPLIVWLDGGPGDGGSGNGNFLQIGPLEIDGVTHRNTTWVKDYHVLFIDAPVGAGFSYVSDASKYRREDDDIASDIHVCLKKFFHKHKEFQSVPMYIVGHSYGAKLAVKLAELLIDSAESLPNNLKGVGLSSPFISPVDTALSLGEYHHKLGFLDDAQRLVIEDVARTLEADVEEENWIEAFWDNMNVSQNLVGYTTFWNLENVSVKSRPRLHSELNETQVDGFMNSEVKQVLGIATNYGERFRDVYISLNRTFIKSAISSVKKLVEKPGVKVVVFAGQMDGIVPHISTEAWVNRIFQKDEEWLLASRNPLLIDGAIEGFEKHHKSFSMYWILRAGHLVTRDNPKAVEVILNRLTNE
ncbi:retinoid-inducible serine carboxypeptidase-like [Diachasma alloeum]|uniref:retinoid-inducible serine carboxypeptidase-like n=1 Tax=Diachasma alloeum TaxID=454923 RepID=UPI0010FB8386|nr:retinoid-inducible serine carboxypeptidase-like [Diachasma alloeum]